ncbi:MAG TPA: nucleotide exchange factor GrpE [Halanaerobiales bacterium]|nr:nucleotide exchange factor GrpE [Halanaerobiales bacterium]
MVAKEDKNFDEEQETVQEEKLNNEENKKETVDLEEDITEEVMEERLDEIKQQLTEVTEEKDEYLNKLKRLKADFVNYRNRAKKEKQQIEVKTKIEFINSLLPVIDNFERALKSVDEDSEFLSGVKMIHKQLIDVLKKEGLEIIDTEGEEFDPAYHEAVMQVESEEVESGHVVEEIQKGYMMEDKVVRPAMVKVAI